MPKPYSKLILLRKTVQALALAGFIYVIWTTRYPLQGFLDPRWFFQIDPLAMGITALAGRIWLPGMLWALGTLAVTFALGRAFCGWLCPLGALLDAAVWPLHRLRRWRESGPGPWRNVKYGLLALLAALGLAGQQYAWFFDPLAIFVRAFSLNIHPVFNRGADHAWAWLLRATGEPVWLEQMYYAAKDSVFGAEQPLFPHAGGVFLVLLLILAAAFLQRRSWCRYLCPLGALLGAAGRFAPLRRQTRECRAGCAVCRHLCRTGAIRADNTYAQGECILCLDCVAGCAQGTASFRFRRRERKQPAATDGGGLTRAQFLQLTAGALALSASAARRAWGAQPARTAGLRPPGALTEAEFVQRCIRCGNCMKVCPTSGLQPALWERGAAGVWTPRLVPEIGYCEYECNLCGRVCPTGAIRPLDLATKQKTPIGLAAVRRDRCIPWTTDSQCLVCEEHCPVPSKAIKILTQRNERGKLMRRPVVDPELCIGCGICENKCPAAPRRAIIVGTR